MRKHPLLVLFCISLAALAAVGWCGHQLKSDPHNAGLLVMDSIFVFVLVGSGVLWIIGAFIAFVKRIWTATLSSAAQPRAGFHPPGPPAPQPQPQAKKDQGDFGGGRGFIPR